MYGATHLVSTLIGSTLIVSSLNFYRDLRDRDINQTLSHYRAQKITTFSLRIPRYVHGPPIDNWIEFVVSRNVEKLTLVFNSFSDHDFQNIFYRSSSLTHLCILHLTTGAACTVSWKSLRNLTLWGCYFCDDESIANILSGSPILETLELFYYTGPQRLDLSKSRRLRRLKIQGPTKIVAPHVHYLSLIIALDKPCTLVDVSSLAETSLHICLDTYLPFYPGFLRTMSTVLIKLLAKLKNVKRLTLTGPVLQILSLAELHGFFFPMIKVEILTVETKFTRYVIPGLAMLLQNSPQLKRLEANPSFSVDIEDRDLDRYLVSQGLNPSQCWRSKYEVFPTSDEFIRIIGRCYYKEETWQLMVLFVEMVMKNIKTLETLVVGWKYIERNVSDPSWFEEYFLQMLPTLSNNNNVSIVFKRY